MLPTAGCIRFVCVPKPRARGSTLLAHAMTQAREQGKQSFAAWATSFSLPVFRSAGFSLERRVRETFRGAMFERYRVALGSGL